MAWWMKLLRRRRLEKDLEDEIAFHRAMRVNDADAPPFGNETQIRETVRDLWRLPWIEALWQDIAYALRSFRRQPGFTAIVVATLALAIGANTAVFSVVNGVVLRPLAYPEPDRLEFVFTQFPGLGFERFSMSLPEFLEFREHALAFEMVGAYSTGEATVGGAQPSRQIGALVTHNLLPTLGVQPFTGRGFEESDSRPGADPVVILSAGLWQREFGANPGVVGSRVEINGVSTLVVGVMPRGFDIRDEKVELLAPLTIDPAALPNTRSNHFLYAIARRKAGIDRAQAQADVDRLLSRWKEIAGPGVHTPNETAHRVAITPLLDDIVGGTRRTLWILQGAVGVVLLIACVNLANLLIARAGSRTQEHALRAALGASRWRLLRQMTTEGLVLAVAASAAGIALAQGGLWLLLSSYPRVLPRIGDITLDWRVLAFTAGVALVVALVFGLVPFVHLLAKDRIGNALKLAGNRTTGGTARARVRTALIVSEVALAVLIVTAAGLLLRSFVNLTSVDVGFDRSNLSSFAVALPGSKYNPAARVAFYRELRTKLEALPGVRSVAVMTGLPTQRFLNASDTDFAHIPNNQPEYQGPAENVDYYQNVSLGYVETMGTRIVAGRNFEAADEGGAPVVLVNEALVRKFFEGLDPIGRQLKRGFSDGSPWFTIVGVVKDIKNESMAAETGTEVYFLTDQVLRISNQAPGSMYAAVRSALPLATLAPQFRRAVAELDASLPITEMKTMDDAIGESITRPRFLLLLLGLLAGMALMLAGVGIYSILAYLVAERHQEIGIRMALGAARQDVVRLVLVRGLGAALTGVMVGIFGAMSLTHVLTSLLFEVTPNDPATLAGGVGVILMVAASACIVPAWRASRVSPLTALRA